LRNYCVNSSIKTYDYSTIHADALFNMNSDALCTGKTHTVFATSKGK